MARVLALSLAVLMIWTVALPAVGFAESSPLQSLADLERMLYGQESQGGSLITRLERIEKDLFGRVERGALLVRIEKVRSFVDLGGIDGSSLKVKIAAVEWMVYQDVKSEESLVNRLKRLEEGVFGEPQTGPIRDRIKNLVQLIWAADDVKTVNTVVEKETLVKIKLEDRVDSSKNKVNDQVPFVVTQDVMIDGKLVITKGTRGVGTITEVNAAGRLGRDGKLKIDFGTIEAVDGTPIRLNIADKSLKENQSLQLAAGASMVGVVLLAGNPIGLAGGLLVKGDDITIEKDVEFFIEVSKPVQVNAISMEVSAVR